MPAATQAASVRGKTVLGHARIPDSKEGKWIKYEQHFASMESASHRMHIMNKKRGRRVGEHTRLLQHSRFERQMHGQILIIGATHLSNFAKQPPVQRMSRDQPSRNEPAAWPL